MVKRFWGEKIVALGKRMTTDDEMQISNFLTIKYFHLSTCFASDESGAGVIGATHLPASPDCTLSFQLARLLADFLIICLLSSWCGCGHLLISASLDQTSRETI